MNSMLKQPSVLLWLCAFLMWAGLAPAIAKDLVQRDTPALWKVQGAQGTVYLLGSIHVMRPEVEWRSPAVDRALRDARLVVFETDLAQAQNPDVLDPLITRHALLPNGQTLKSVIPTTTYAELERTSGDLGLPVESLSNMRPWFVAMLLSLQSITKLGFDPNNGVDLQVYNWAVANKKKMGALEALEVQIKMLSELTREQENELLLATLTQARELPTMMNDMMTAYRRGDAMQLDKLINSSMDPYPDVRARVLKDRNDKWLPQVERMLKEEGTHLIVVGVAHLVGRDSLVTLLRAKGFKVEGP
ncbi:MAG TPA: TraB/GumN family protein [Burkholderiales bacterium]|jgi:uncharacterized protein|nr:TraB/GumN family protein [Burkholderiales bacterium]